MNHGQHPSARTMYYNGHNGQSPPIEQTLPTQQMYYQPQTMNYSLPQQRQQPYPRNPIPSYHPQQIMNNNRHPPHPQSLQQIIATSQEHQKCLQFLQSRNFSPNTPTGQRQIIIQKIRNALANNYKNKELQRRTKILQQCATYILKPHQPPPPPPKQPQPPPQPQPSKPSKQTINAINHTNTPNIVFDDLLSTNIATNNSNNQLPHITDDAMSTTSGNTPHFPNAINPNSKVLENNNKSADFDDFGANPFDDDDFSEFASAKPQDSDTPHTPKALDINTKAKTHRDTFDLLDLDNNNNANTNTTPILKEDDFESFVNGIKPAPSIEAYMQAAFTGKLSSVGRAKQQKMNVMKTPNKAPPLLTSTDIPSILSTGLGHKSSRALPDILNQLIDDKLHKEDFGDEDVFQTAEQSVDDDFGDFGDEEQGHEQGTEGEEENEIEIEMNEFITAAGAASEEYNKKLELRQKEEAKKKQSVQEIIARQVGAAAVKDDDDPFLALFGSVSGKKDGGDMVVDDDDWGDFDNAAMVIQNDVKTEKIENILNIATSNDIEVDEVGVDDFFDAQFEDEDAVKNKAGHKQKGKDKKSKKERKKDKKKERKRKRKEKKKEESRNKVDIVGIADIVGMADIVGLGDKMNNIVVDKVDKIENDNFFNGFDDSPLAKTPKTAKTPKAAKKINKPNTNINIAAIHTEENDIDFAGFDDEWEQDPPVLNKTDKTAKTPKNDEKNNKTEKNDKKDNEKTDKKPKKRKDKKHKKEKTHKKDKSKKVPKLLDEPEEDEEDWGDFENEPSNDINNNIEMIPDTKRIKDSKDLNELDEDDEDWGDFGDGDDNDNDNDTRDISKVSNNNSTSGIIGGSFPLEPEEPSEAQQQQQLTEVDDEEEDEELFSKTHDDLDLELLDQQLSVPDTEISISRSITIVDNDNDNDNEHNVDNDDNEDNENENGINDEYENPFAAMIDDDVVKDEDMDNPFEQEGDEDGDEEDWDEEPEEKKEFVMDMRDIMEAIENEQYEKALLLYDLLCRHRQLHGNKGETEILEGLIEENKKKIRDDEDNALYIAQKQEHLHALIQLEDIKIRLNAEIKEIEGEIKNKNINSMDILQYTQLFEMSKQHNKLLQFNLFFNTKFRDYVSYKSQSDDFDDLRNELESVVNQQQRAHFFINCISAKPNAINIDFKLYKQLLLLAQDKFDDANEKLIKLSKNLAKYNDNFFNVNNAKLADVFISRLADLLVLYRVCKTIGNGLDLIKDALSENDIIKQCIKAWRIIYNKFNHCILTARNDIIEKFIIKQEEDGNDDNVSIYKLWDIQEYNQSNHVLPNKEQISQILMHMNQI